MLFGKECSGHLGLLPKLGYTPPIDGNPRRTQRKDKLQPLFLSSYGQASLHLGFSFSFKSFFCCLPSKESAALHHNHQMEIFSLWGRGQTRGLTLRYTVFVIDNERLRSRTAPDNELEIQNQGSLEMATRQLFGPSKN